MFRGRPAIAVALSAIAFATTAGARDAVPWTAAAEHVGRLATIEGVIAAGRTTAEGRAVLEFDPDDPTALRVVLVVPLVTDLPREPHRLYLGKRVEVSGRVARFQGRLEMAVTPAQIEVVGLTTAPPAVAPAPAHPAPAPAAPAPRAPAAVEAPAASTPPSPPSPPTMLEPDPTCRALADERGALQVELRERNGALQRCLAAGRSGCAVLGDRLGPLLSRLDAVEQQLERRCP